MPFITQASSNSPRFQRSPYQKSYQPRHPSFQLRRRYENARRDILPQFVIDRLRNVLRDAKVSRLFLPRLVGLIESLDGVSHLGSIADFYHFRGFQHFHSDLYIGDIIIVPFVSPCIDPRANLTDDKYIFSPRIGPVEAYKRPAIVVAKHKQSLICLPMFTSHGRGMHESARDDCLWIRDPSQYAKRRDEQDLPPEVLVCQNFGMARRNNYIDLTRSYTVLDTFPVEKINRLQFFSTNRLKERWQAVNMRGHQLINEQVRSYPPAGGASSQQISLPIDSSLPELPRPRKRRRESST